jgi:hypothetical protein
MDDLIFTIPDNTGVIFSLGLPMRNLLCHDQKKYAIAKDGDAARPSNPPASPWQNCSISLFFRMSWKPCGSAICGG